MGGVKSTNLFTNIMDAIGMAMIVDKFRHMDFNMMRQRPMSLLLKETRKNLEYLRNLGYDVREIWICEWQKQIKERSDIHEFIQA